jgi:predicted kinase
VGIYLLAGPPCSGKSTLAGKLAKPGDPILDFDTICAELDGRPGWDHNRATQRRAEALMARRMRQLHHHAGDAYVIRCAPDRIQRAHLARQLQATVWVLNPGKDTCLRRARADRRPASTVSGIAYWYRTYRPAACDTSPPEPL